MKLTFNNARLLFFPEVSAFPMKNCTDSFMKEKIPHWETYLSLINKTKLPEMLQESKLIIWHTLSGVILTKIIHTSFTSTEKIIQTIVCPMLIFHSNSSYVFQWINTLSYYIFKTLRYIHTKFCSNWSGCFRGEDIPKKQILK